MLLEETVEDFLQSRRHGTGSAKGPARDKTLKNYEWGMKHFSDFIADRGRVNYEDITRKDVAAFLDHLRKLSTFKSEATRTGVLRGVKALMRHVEQEPDFEGVTLSKFLGRIAATKIKERIPSITELNKLREQVKVTGRNGLRNYTVFSLLIGTGLRNGELRNLRVEDLHLDDRMLNVPKEGKTGARLVPLDTTLVGILKAWSRKRAKSKHVSPWLFPGKLGAKLEESSVTQVFYKLQKHLPANERITPHTLRHVFGTMYMENDGSMERCRLIMGHKSYETMRIYLHMGQVSSAKAKAEIERVSPLKQLHNKIA